MKRTKSQTWKKKAPPKKAKFDRLDLFKEPKRQLVKREDVQLNNVAFTNVNTVVANSLFSVGQGTDVFQRVGNSVALKSINLRGSLSPNVSIMAATNYPPDVLRVIVFYDRQPNNSTPRYLDVLGITGAVASADPVSPPNFNQRERFLILKNFQVATPAFSATIPIATPVFSNVGIPIPTASELKLEFYKNLKEKLQVIYNGTGTTTTSQVTGGLFVALQCYNSTCPWVMDLTSAVEYVDIQ